MSGQWLSVFSGMPFAGGVIAFGALTRDLQTCWTKHSASGAVETRLLFWDLLEGSFLLGVRTWESSPHYGPVKTSRD